MKYYFSFFICPGWHYCARNLRGDGMKQKVAEIMKDK